MFWHQFLFGASLITVGYPLMMVAAWLAFSIGQKSDDSHASSGDTAIRVTLMLIAFAVIAFGSVDVMERLFSIRASDVVVFSTIAGLTGPTLAVTLGVFCLGCPLAYVVTVVIMRALMPTLVLLSNAIANVPRWVVAAVLVLVHVLMMIPRLIAGAAGLIATIALVMYAEILSLWRRK